MATIVILEHALQGGVRLPYMVYEFAKRWQASGHRVIVHRGTEGAPEADLAILNVDLTVVPEAYRTLAARYPRVVNGRVFDISKRSYSESLVDRSSDWPGAVIVKTDANFGGRPEQLLRSVATLANASSDIVGGPVVEEYPIYASLHEVPDFVWATAGLIVEKFLPEHDARGYYLRVWTFFGDREGSSRYRANVPVIKAQDILDREAAEVPAEIRAWRARLGFDFGKFDYVQNAGRFVLLDANRTPAFPPTLLANPRAATLLDTLAGGLDAILSGRA
jgi:hypothetical protein